MNNFSETIPTSVVDDNDDGSGEIEVSFNWLEGQAPSGLSGPPENSDPGYGEEFEITGATIVVPGGKGPDYPLDAEAAEAVAEYLSENWERPDYEADMADYRYEQQRDERMELND